MTSSLTSLVPYRHVLAVVDLSDDSLEIGARARMIAAAHGASLGFLHVVEYVPVEPLGEPMLPTSSTSHGGV